MKNNNITQQTSFWDFLQNHKIEIPIIQRDYAQGRQGKEKLREKFLADLKGVLESEDKRLLKLDFVYGSEEKGSLHPLDGQQRLTTLWLLHWYIALKSGNLNNETVERLKNFTYETRTSSREFCEKIAIFNSSESNVVTAIQDQTWFYSSWKQDPTIQSMLNMISGTPEKDDKEKDIIDGLEEVFKDTVKTHFERYWTKLTAKDCPIIFYYLDLQGLSLSDDLYIKMNARGKQLTSFENFKADLVGFIKKEKLEEESNPLETFAHKLDADWTDIFWKYRSSEHRIDDIYFTFLNRFILNNLMVKNLYLQDKIDKESSLFKYLYGKNGNDTTIEYSGFNVYEKSVKILQLDKIKKTLDSFHKSFKEKTKVQINTIFQPSWGGESFSFIPKYLKENERYTVKSITQSHRVVFHAVCKYFENNKYNEESFKKWMRVVWNIVENSNIDGISTMIGVIRLIDELGQYSEDIYEFLADDSRVLKSEVAKEQVTEEREKAKQIMINIGWKDANGFSWEEKIIEAENAAFFKGAIRFLYRDDNSEVNWLLFEKRYTNSIKYFTKDGVSEEFKKDAFILRHLISHFTERKQFENNLAYDFSIKTWKKILTDKIYIKSVSRVLDVDLLECAFSSFSSPLSDVKDKFFHEDLVKSTILSKIVSACTFHWWNYGGYYSLYPYNTKSQSKIFVLADKRNEVLYFLEQKKIIEVDKWQKIEGLPYYRGWEIYFTLLSTQKKYQWWQGLKELNNENEWEDKGIDDINTLEEFLIKENK